MDPFDIDAVLDELEAAEPEKSRPVICRKLDSTPNVDNQDQQTGSCALTTVPGIVTTSTIAVDHQQQLEEDKLPDVVPSASSLLLDGATETLLNSYDIRKTEDHTAILTATTEDLSVNNDVEVAKMCDEAKESAKEEEEHTGFVKDDSDDVAGSDKLTGVLPDPDRKLSDVSVEKQEGGEEDSLLLRFDDSSNTEGYLETGTESNIDATLSEKENPPEKLDDSLVFDPLEAFGGHVEEESYMSGLESLPPEIFLFQPSQPPPEFSAEEVVMHSEVMQETDSETFSTPPETPFVHAKPEDFDNYTSEIKDVQDVSCENRGETSRCSSTSTSSICDEEPLVDDQEDVLEERCNSEQPLEAIDLPMDETQDPEADYVTLALPQTREEGVEVGQASGECQQLESQQEVGLEVEESSENRVIGFHSETETTAEELQQLEAELAQLEGALEGSLDAEIADSAEPNQIAMENTPVEPAEAAEAKFSESTEKPEAESTENPAEPAQARSLIASSHDLGASCSMRLTESEMQLGKMKPNWVPDADSQICMLCEAKFSVLKRRHHCRACGRVLCGDCCTKKALLAYQPDKEQKICEPCDTLLQRIKEYENERKGEKGLETLAAEGVIPQEMAENSADSTNSATKPPSGRKSVVFSDGIRPGTCVAGGSTEAEGNSRQKLVGTNKKNSKRQSRAAVARVQEMESFLPEMNCPSSVRNDQDSSTKEGEELLFDWPPLVSEGVRQWISRGSLEEVWKKLEDYESPCVEFAVKRNLSVNVKLLKLKCCSPKQQLWCFTTQGMRCVAQDEIMVLFERAPEDNSLPLDMLRIFDFIYENALQGHRIGDLGHLVFAEMSGLNLKSEGFLGSREHAGFVFFRPTMQCLRRLPVPDRPYLVGYLILKTEIPWAKILPMRLLYRLGAEYHFYPCPLMSVRNRKAMFNDDIGHTVMNLLADFRNYSFSLASVRGSRVHLTDTEIKILLPRSQHSQMMKIVEGTQQHVIAWATCFSREADSHLVCVQDSDSGSYQSQIICADNRRRTVTGGTFVVLNACLKGTSGSCQVFARSMMTEDGVMIQMRPETMETLIGQLKERGNHVISEGQSEEGKPKQTRIVLEWTDDPEGISNNAGYCSPIDGRMLENLPCLKVSGRIADHSGGDGRLLRMTELFVLETDLSMDRLAECSGELLALGRHVVNAAAKVLLPYGHELAQTGLRAVGIRISLGPDTMEYQSGAGGQSLPDQLTGKLDGELVPLLFTRAQAQGYLLTVELILRLLDLM